MENSQDQDLPNASLLQVEGGDSCPIADLCDTESQVQREFAIEVGNRSTIYGCLVAVALVLRTAGRQGFCWAGV